MDRDTAEAAVPTSYPVTRSTPDAAALDRAAELLAGAEHPIVVAGDGVHFAQAAEELGRLAEVWGAEVWGADWAEVNLPAEHPAYAGQLGHMFGESSRRVTGAADAVLIVGTYALPEVYPVLDGVFAEGTPVVHIDLDSDAIAKNFPVDLGLVADPRRALAGLTAALQARMSEESRVRAFEWLRRRSVERAREIEEARQVDEATTAPNALPTTAFLRELARQLPEDAVVFDEALTASPDVSRHLPPNRPGHWFQTRGGSLGVGIPGALGAQLAFPGRTVVGFTGDGGSMYTIQALWTAARHGIGAKFVICNNSSYKLLELNIEEYWKSQAIAAHEQPEIFDLSRPAIDFVGLARSLGVPAVRVEKPDQVQAAVAEALSTEGPFLIDLVTGRGRE